MSRGSARFGPRQRLKTPVDFRRVFEAPQRTSDAYLQVLTRGNGQLSARLGMALARKNIPTAVARNRVKRVIRESFRRHQQQLVGLDIVVLARTDLTHVSNQALLESLTNHWARHAKQCKV